MMIEILKIKHSAYVKRLQNMQINLMANFLGVFEQAKRSTDVYVSNAIEVIRDFANEDIASGKTTLANLSKLLGEDYGMHHIELLRLKDKISEIRLGTENTLFTLKKKIAELTRVENQGFEKLNSKFQETVVCIQKTFENCAQKYFEENDCVEEDVIKKLDALKEYIVEFTTEHSFGDLNKKEKEDEEDTSK